MISAIIPIYNREKYISKCLDSILNSIYSDFEVIIVNDGSTDTSLEICKKYELKDRRIKVINQNNHGVSYARNVGLDNAKGDWIVFIDSDDMITSNFFSLIYDNIDNETDLMIFNYTYTNNSNKTNIFNETAKADKNYLIKKSLASESISDKINLNSPWAKAYKKSIISKQNLKFEQNINLGEDKIFNLNYFFESSNIKIINKSVYIVNLSLNSLSRSFKKDYMYNAINYQNAILKFLNRNNIYNIYKTEYIIGVAKSINDILKYYIFNNNNKIAFKEKTELCDSLHEYPYNLTFCKLNINTKYKLMIYLLKKRYYRLLNIMYFLKGKI